MKNDSNTPTEPKTFWPERHDANTYKGFDLEARAQIAFDMLGRGTLLASMTKLPQEGETRVELASPAELVSRAFEIADLFVDRCIARGEIRPSLTDEESFRRGGLMMKIRDRAHGTWFGRNLEEIAEKVAEKEAKEESSDG